jgi:hypothetical protein
MLVSQPVSSHSPDQDALTKTVSVWISPVSQNYEGPRTAYGDAYHGYWIADASQLNSRFGTSDDLKSLSTELHRRGMFVTSTNSICLHSQMLCHWQVSDGRYRCE